MRRAWWLAACAGCSFHHELGDAGSPDTPVIFDDGGNQLGWLRADSAADFGEPGAAFDAIAIDEAALTPAAYLWGGLVARAAGTCPVADQNTLDYAAFAGLTPSGIAFIDTIEIPDQRAPAGFRTDTNDGDFAVWIEGEMQLPAGTTSFTLSADDFAALEIATPHSTAFARVTTNQFQGPATTAAYTTTAAGWYPFRIPMCQKLGGGYRLSLLATPDTTPATAIPRKRLRARVDGLRGLIATAWDQQSFGMRASSSLWTAPLVDDTLDPPPPGPKNPGDLAIRWVGETKIATAGSFLAHADTDDGARIVLGETSSDDHLTQGGSNIITDVTTPLGVGWRPLALDYMNIGGDGRARFQLNGDTIPVDRLRPAATSATRVVTFYDDQSQAIPTDANGQTRSWRAQSFPTEAITDLWVTYKYTHQQPHELALALIGPDGTSATLRGDNDNDTTNPKHVRLANFNGKLLAGLWKLVVKDQTGGQTGSLDSWSIAAFVTGGPPVLAPASSWTSATHEIAATVIDTVTFAAIVPPGSSAAAWVRTCDDTPCDDEPWTGPYQSGDPVTSEPRRYAQVRVDLTATTDEEPALDWVELQYRFRP